MTSAARSLLPVRPTAAAPGDALAPGCAEMFPNVYSGTWHRLRKPRWSRELAVLAPGRVELGSALTHRGTGANQHHRHPRRIVERRARRVALTQHSPRRGAKLLGIVGTDVPQHPEREIVRQTGSKFPPPSRIRRHRRAEYPFQRPEIDNLTGLAGRRTDMRQTEMPALPVAPIEYRPGQVVQ